MPTNRTSSKPKKVILGKHFFQENLPWDLQMAIAGQPIGFKLISITTILIFSIVSGCIAGLLGALILLEFAIPTDALHRFWYLCAFLVIISCLISTIFIGINKGLLVVLIGTLLSFVFLPLTFPKESFFTFASISLALLILNGAIMMSLFSGCFSLALGYSCFKKTQIFIIFHILLTIVTARIIASSFSLAPYFTEEYLEDAYQDAYQANLVLGDLSLSNIQEIAVICGTLFGIGIVIAVVVSSQLAPKGSNYWDFFRTWAIAVGSWGGTSFYNLDLSEVNFRNAKLANTDLRARKLYRTCFQGVTGLERARVDNRYLDLEHPKVQRLLTHGYCEDKDFSQLNLRGAYLQNANMRHFNLTDTELTGADMRSADLQGSILVRAQVIGVDFTHAKLTGICIQDWSVNSQTDFTEVECDYIYRELDEQGEPTDRFPANRNFEPREFESLYQQVGTVVELIFKEGENWQAALFSLKKLQLEDEDLELELKGIEKRGDVWVVKVSHNVSYSKQEVEQRLNATFDEMKHQLAAKEQQINQLLGIVADQAEALKGYSKQPFGNSFFIMGSTITNLAGSGQIDYDEAANQVRSIVANGGDSTQAMTITQSLLGQLQGQSVATTSEQQMELIQQVILTEAQKDPFFKQFLIQQGQQITTAMPENAIASAIQNAIAHLR